MILSQHLSERTEKRKLSRVAGLQGQDLNVRPFEHKARMLTIGLRHSVEVVSFTLLTRQRPVKLAGL
jgi:hypothetical protein